MMKVENVVWILVIIFVTILFVNAQIPSFKGTMPSAVLLSLEKDYSKIKSENGVMAERIVALEANEDYKENVRLRRELNLKASYWFWIIWGWFVLVLLSIAATYYVVNKRMNDENIYLKDKVENTGAAILDLGDELTRLKIRLKKRKRKK